MNLRRSKRNLILTKEDIRKLIDKFNITFHSIIGPIILILGVVLLIVAILWSKSIYLKQIADPNQSYMDGYDAFYDGNIVEAKVYFETAMKNGFSLRECDGYILLIDKISQTYQAPNTNTNDEINAFREVQSDDASLDANLHWLIACETLEQTLTQCETNYLQFESSSDIEKKLLELQEWNKKKRLPENNEKVQFWLHRALYVQAKASYQLALNEYWNNISRKIEKRTAEIGESTLADNSFNHTDPQTKDAKTFAEACSEYIEELCKMYSSEKPPSTVIRDKNEIDLTHLIEKVDMDSFAGNNNFYDKDYYLKQLLLDEYFPPDEYFSKIKYLQDMLN